MILHLYFKKTKQKTQNKLKESEEINHKQERSIKQKINKQQKKITQTKLYLLKNTNKVDCLS